MQGIRFPYLDLCVWQPLRKHVLSLEPAVLFDLEIKKALWANAAGAQFFGGTGVAELLETEPSSSQPFIRQIIAAAEQIEDGEPLVRGFRVVRGLRSELIQCELSKIPLPDGDSGILIICDLPQRRKVGPEADAEAALLAVNALEDFADAAAVLDDHGLIVAASSAFEDIEIAYEDLAEILSDLQGETDRLVKRPIETMDQKLYGTGIARLKARPGRNLFVLVAAESEEMLSTNADAETETDIEPPFVPDPRDALGEAPDDEGNPDDLDFELRPEPSVTAEAETDEVTEPEADADETAEPAPNNEVETDIASDGSADTPSSGVMGRARSLLDRWYKSEKETTKEDERFNPFGDDDQASETTADNTEASKQTDQFTFTPVEEPVRFAWSIDETQIFRSVSMELGETVGPNAADVVGRSWKDVAQVFGFDQNGDIQELLSKQDTWSGRSVLWPVQGTDQSVPIDLAALPSFGSNRAFEGFRGFGIIRTGDAVTDPIGTGISLADAPIQKTTDARVDGEDGNFFTESDEPEGLGLLTGEDGENEASASDPVSAEEDTPTSPTEDLSDETLETPGEEKDAASIGDLGSNIVNMVPRLKTQDKAQSVEPLSERESKAFDTIGKRLGKDEANAPAKDLSGAGVGIADENSEDADQDTSNAILSQREDEDIDADLTEPTPPLAPEAAADDVSDDAGTDETDSSAKEIEGEESTDDTENDEGLPQTTYTAILDRLTSPILIYMNGVTFYANQELLELTGYTSVDELSRAGGVDAILHSTAFSDMQEGQKTILINRDGGEIEVDARLQSVPWEDQRALMLTFNREEITSRPAKVATTAIDEARVIELQNILDTATDGIIILDENGIMESVNSSAAALFGVEPDQVSGKHLNALFAHESHLAIDEYLEAFRQGLPLTHDGNEMIAKENKGGLFPVYMTIGKTGNGPKLCAVIRDLTEWKKVEEELVSAKRNAETASEHKTDFLARVSHEIRTPLNAIIGFSDVMIEERFGPIENERYRGYLKDIQRSGAHVLDLVNDLLDLSKIEAGNIDLSFEAVDLNAIVSETVALMQPQANTDRIIIRTSLSRAVPNVVADVRSMRQIVLNLVSNAIKFTPSNGQVIVSTVYESNGEVALRIRDTGVGMNEEQLVDAMKPFQQIRGITDKRDGGTGLGLPLTKALVEANRAFFDLESKPNDGTIAHVQFPTQRVLAD